jgi:phage/plasmid-associated DNA primase
MLTNLVVVTYEHLHQMLSKSAHCSVLVNVALVMVSDIEKKDKCQKSDLENALTGAVLKIEVSYAHHGLRN